jgi:hypothetical protein
MLRPTRRTSIRPIERAFAKLKSFLRKVAARSIPELWDAVRLAINRFEPKECENFFAMPARMRNPNYPENALDRGNTRTFNPDFLAWTDKTAVAIDTKGDHLITEDAGRKLFYIEKVEDGPELVIRLDAVMARPSRA